MVSYLLDEFSFLESAVGRPSAGSQLSLAARHTAPTCPLVCQVSRQRKHLSVHLACEHRLARVQCRIPYSARAGTLPV